MNGFKPSRLLALAALATALHAPAGPVNFTLAEYAFNIDGTVSDYAGGAGGAPGGVNLAAFDTATGLGSISMTLRGAGSHHAGLFVDHEIDEALNTFFNEFGGTAGSLAAGQSWEIDEPGFRPVNPGDIFANFSAAALDGSNGLPATAPDDVSLAMAWSFLLDVGEKAVIDFRLSETAPASGFYLIQSDPDSQRSLYLSTALSIVPDSQLPEPAGGPLAALALLIAAAARRCHGPRRP